MDNNEITTDGPEKWVPEAIAQQEEYLKRRRGCNGVSLVSHAFRDFGKPGPDGTIANALMWRACIVCGVTETNEDYETKLKAGRS